MLRKFSRFRKVSATQQEHFDGKHRFEHWYRDNTVYFITTRCRDKYPAFKSEIAKEVFWDRLNHWSQKYNFELWITSLLDNHYHLIGYLKTGENLGRFMQKFHGSVAKLTNDILESEHKFRHLPFWRTAGNKDYFDGCLRDESQLRRVYRYTQLQAVRSGLVRDSKDYPHTRVSLSLEKCLAQADKLKAYLRDVSYKRYEGTPLAQ